MTCPSCGTPNAPGTKFCGECGTRLAIVCPTCGTPSEPGRKFCGECGTALAAGTPAWASTGAGPGAGPGAAATGGFRPYDPSVTPGASTIVPPGALAGGSASPAAPAVAERRLVSVMFADLVGFTTLSEGRDPEEVRELLSRYFETTREQIERYGGTVEKFIGDAVMAVWGAPTAHEDDAERSVRAALEVVQAVKDLLPGLQARAGVLTGEAAVTVGARNQGMVAGDLVNTASRVQSVAPPGVVLVDETTRHATAGAIAYEPAGEHLLKGRTAPVPTFRALRVVARRGGAGRGDRLEPPFVGRDSELRLLKDLFHQTAREKRVRLVSITGQAGIGKSRLAWELRKYGDGVAEEVFWHEGRSPAYGSGVTFWALGEMVRARAQLVETDDAATTRGKIGESVARFFPPGEDRDRVERALAALLGVSDAPAGGAEELFGAWRLYFERMAAESLVTMVFEDLQWADAGQLDFIDHVLEWSRNVPILIITLARPELLERRPDWGAGRRNFLALHLEPLDEGSMRELLAGIVPGLSDSAIRSIVARAEGIPLYAVETIRMLAANGRLRERDEGGGFEPVGELGELAVPDTLHALIAARLDGLEPADRSLVQDAAVLGQSFTPAGLAAVSGLDEATLTARLRSLVKADLLVEERDERSPERGQFAFVQALIREVAYSTLSLRDRKTRHLAAARFFEALGEDELAGALAAHYLAAYRATTDADEAAPLAAQARIALRAAAERAAGLGSQRQALAFLEQALDVRMEDRDRAELLERATQVAFNAADYEPAASFARQLRELSTAVGDRGGEALAIALEAEVLWSERQRERAAQILLEALPRFDDLRDDRAVRRMVADLATYFAFSKHYDEALAMADRALGGAERANDPEMASRMLGVKGNVSFFLGRLWEGTALLEGARHLAEKYGLQDQVVRINNGLTNLLALDDPRAALTIEREIIALSRRLGRREQETITIGNAAEDARRIGEWDWSAGELERAIRDEDRNVTDLILEVALSIFQILRGQLSAEQVQSVVARVAGLDDQDVSSATHDLEAYSATLGGDYGAAAGAWLAQADASDLNAPYALPKAGLAFVLAHDASGAETVLERLGALGARGRAIEADMDEIRAGLAAIRGDRDTSLAGFRSIRSRFRDLGLAWDVALSAVIAASCLRPADAEIAAWLGEARLTFEQLRARPIVAIVDRQLAEVTGAEAGAPGGPGGPGARPADGSAAASVADQSVSVSST